MGEVGRGITVYLATSYNILPTSGSTAGELNNWRAVFGPKMGEHIEILQNPFIGSSLVHVCTYSRNFRSNLKKKFAGCNGLTVVLARQWKVRFNLREEVSAPCFFPSSCIIYLWPQGKPNHWRQWLSNGRVCQDLPSVRWYCFCGQGGLEWYFQLHPALSDSL